MNSPNATHPHTANLQPNLPQRPSGDPDFDLNNHHVYPMLFVHTYPEVVATAMRGKKIRTRLQQVFLNLYLVGTEGEHNSDKMADFGMYEGIRIIETCKKGFPLFYEKVLLPGYLTKNDGELIELGHMMKNLEGYARIRLLNAIATWMDLDDFKSQKPDPQAIMQLAEIAMALDPQRNYTPKLGESEPQNKVALVVEYRRLYSTLVQLKQIIKLVHEAHEESYAAAEALLKLLSCNLNKSFEQRWAIGQSVLGEYQNVKAQEGDFRALAWLQHQVI